MAFAFFNVSFASLTQIRQALFVHWPCFFVVWGPPPSCFCSTVRYSVHRYTVGLVSASLHCTCVCPWFTWTASECELGCHTCSQRWELCSHGCSHRLRIANFVARAGRRVRVPEPCQWKVQNISQVLISRKTTYEVGVMDYFEYVQTSTNLTHNI